MRSTDGDRVQVHVPQGSLTEVDSQAIRTAIRACGFEVEIVEDAQQAGFLHHVALVVVDILLGAGEAELGSLVTQAVWNGMKPPMKALRRLGHKILIVFTGHQDPPPTYVLPADLPDSEIDRALDSLGADLAEGTRITRTVTWRRWDPAGGLWEMTDTTEIRR
jgi:hypothetical protein